MYLYLIIFLIHLIPFLPDRQKLEGFGEGKVLDSPYVLSLHKVSLYLITDITSIQSPLSFTRLIHLNGFSEEERQVFRLIIHCNVTESTLALLGAMTKLGISFSNPKVEVNRQFTLGINFKPGDRMYHNTKTI